MPTLFFSLALLTNNTPLSPTLQTQMISTRIGEIAVHTRWVADTRPVVFLHGVYFDHHLWDAQIAQIKDRTVIAIDMPLHGQSQHIHAAWTLADCAEMLVEVLDGLGIEQVVAIGHSWGSMTILQAASRYPQRFVALGLCNMPLERTSLKRQRQFKLQHLMLPFRKFYARKAGESLLAAQSISEDPELLTRFIQQFLRLPAKTIKQTDRAVILDAPDNSHLPAQLPMPAFALKGETDYVPTPSGIPTTLVPGGHISPWEQAEAVTHFVQMVLQKSKQL